VIYVCCDDRRREAVRDDGRLNGIDFLEVEDRPGDPDDVRQRRLVLHLLRDVEPGTIDVPNVRITGGERIRNIRVVAVWSGPVDSPPVSSPTVPADVIVVEVAQPGDFSTYTLQLIQPGTNEPPNDFDPVLSTVEFSFKAACASAFDCAPRHVCPPQTSAAPEINYLARDYASFRQMMLDRLAVLTPHWTERNPADLGIALVEALAYVADYLSYEQDAIATEAYLRTARRRVSVKRHARLIDYFMHDGANARAWVQVVVRDDVTAFDLQLKATDGSPAAALLTRLSDLPPVAATDSPDVRSALTARPETFEPVAPPDAPLSEDGTATFTVRPEHNRMRFYTWGDAACCLPEGSTRATLRGAFPNLVSGMVLVFVEERGPDTGVPGDADPAHRHAVRLVESKVTSDPAGGLFAPVPNQGAFPVTEIRWGLEDALPFPLCVSSRREMDGQPTSIDDVSVALGNIVLVDHGRTTSEELPPVPGERDWLDRVSSGTGSPCELSTSVRTHARYRPTLSESPLTYAPGYGLDHPDTSAASVMRWPEKTPLPTIRLGSGEDAWKPDRDLLASGPEDKRFVVEVEADGTAYLRFGNDRQGKRPGSGLRLTATYRTGNGTAGNVGRETIAHLISSQPGILDAIARVWNPMAARGGVNPESMEEVRQRAPASIRTQERAVIETDFADLVRRFRADVQKIAATFRWTGSWRTVFITADRLGGAPVDEAFERELRARLEPFRMAGQDLEVDAPVPVPLDIAMHVCVSPDYAVSDVRAALLEQFSNRTLADGRKGLFHPDRFSFGQAVHLSPLYAAAQAVAGVHSVEITTFEHPGVSTAQGLADGRLDMGRLEIPRLDNDPNFRERGVFTLTLSGGR
jgi:Baseplate J-like protein